MTVLAIDPGFERSAYVVYDEPKIVEKGIISNIELVGELHGLHLVAADVLAIEMIASYGMPVGREVFATCVWIGRFVEAWGGRVWAEVYRREVKSHLCRNSRAKDSNIRQALIDRFGPGRELAIGKKAAPGPLYGVAKDEWAALAVAVTYSDSIRAPGVLAVPGAATGGCNA